MRLSAAQSRSPRPGGQATARPGVSAGRCPCTIARPAVLKARLKLTTANEASASTPRLSSVDGVHDEVVAVHLVARRRRGTHEAVDAAVVAAA